MFRNLSLVVGSILLLSLTACGGDSTQTAVDRGNSALAQMQVDASNLSIQENVDLDTPHSSSAAIRQMGHNDLIATQQLLQDYINNGNTVIWAASQNGVTAIGDPDLVNTRASIDTANHLLDLVNRQLGGGH